MSPQLAELNRIAEALEAIEARLGVLAGLRLGVLVVELRALGEEWEQAMEVQVGLLEEANAALEERQEEAA